MLTPNPNFVDHLTTRARENGVPETLIDGLVQYCAGRRPTGDFLRAVLANDLRDALRRADPRNRRGLYEIVVFQDQHATRQCWGSPAIVEAWLGSEDPVPENFD